MDNIKIEAIVLATTNPQKILELKQLLSDVGCPVKTIEEMGIKIRIDETGKTYEENSHIKATRVADMICEAFGEFCIVIAEDSGFEVDYLNGDPGIYSARYMGEDVSYHDKCLWILREMEGVPIEKRRAKYVSAITALVTDPIYRCHQDTTVSASIGGYVGDKISTDGFGYNPIFYPDGVNKSYAELSIDEINSISQRSIAIMMLMPFITKMIYDYDLSGHILRYDGTLLMTSPIHEIFKHEGKGLYYDSKKCMILDLKLDSLYVWTEYPMNKNSKHGAIIADSLDQANIILWQNYMLTNDLGDYSTIIITEYSFQSGKCVSSVCNIPKALKSEDVYDNNTGEDKIYSWIVENPSLVTEKGKVYKQRGKSCGIIIAKNKEGAMELLQKCADKDDIIEKVDLPKVILNEITGPVSFIASYTE